ncbi:MAG: response regulator transcription factor [Chloroflexota bacterium]|nr:MAG: response regulator transcription factor [Chloroflexota bacterium]
MTAKIRIVIADDHPIVRRGLRTVIKTQPDMELLGEATNGAEAVALVKTHQPDIVIMDLQMPVQDGMSAIRELNQAGSPTRVVVLTSFPDDDHVFAAIKAGATGLLLKDSSPKDLLEAIRYVHQGESALHPTIAMKVLMEVKQASNQTSAVEPLTARELEVLNCLALGMTNAEIANQLSVSVRTVTTHVRAILDKLHLANRTQAALYAREKGIGTSRGA